MSEVYLDIKVVTGLRVRYNSPDFKMLTIKATNPWTGEEYIADTPENEEFHVNIHYPTPWKIQFYCGEELLTTVDLSYEGANVGIRFATDAIGDTLAWVPVVEEWMRKTKPANVYIYTKWNHLFDKSKYPSNLHWIENPDEEFQKIPLNLFHVLGISRLHDDNLNPRNNHATSVHWQDCNMIDTQNYTFGVSLEERKPKLVQLQDQRPFPEKYVTICTGASQKIKHWLNPMGWTMLARACQAMGYKVISVGNSSNYIPNIHNGTSEDIYQAMYLIKHSEFHIGLSSGLAWMAWTYNKPVLMVGDFTHTGYEFTSNLVRMYSESEQSGVFNKLDMPWIPTWEHDPYNDNMQLARQPKVSHALKSLNELVGRLGTEFKGIYVLPDGTVKGINKLVPKIIPLNYS
jgi:autotransporter strand-loop-strand O-heptosyltransferase